jgi:hypothetical protein
MDNPNRKEIPSADQNKIIEAYASVMLSKAVFDKSLEDLNITIAEVAGRLGIPADEKWDIETDASAFIKVGTEIATQIKEHIKKQLDDGSIT